MWFDRVWIDPHYELKHSESINDKLICELVMQLHGKTWNPVLLRPDSHQFFESNLERKNKWYRLIWLIPPDKDYLGVRNAYRRKIR